MSFVRKKKKAESLDGVACHRKTKSVGSHTDLCFTAHQRAVACSDTICFGLLQRAERRTTTRAFGLEQRQLVKVCYAWSGQHSSESVNPPSLVPYSGKASR